MKVKELLEELSKYDENLEVAFYSNENECDSKIEEVKISNTNEYGIDDCYCQDDTHFADCGKVVVISDESW